MWGLSLGPAPRIAGTPLGIPGPYAILAMLPGFDGIRVPARFWMLAVMCLATAAALAVARIASPARRRTVIAAAIAGLLLDGWPRTFPIVAVPAMRRTSTNAQVRLGLPLHETETETMYTAIAQERAVFNGYSGYAAPQHAALRDLLEHHDARILPRLAAGEPIEVIIDAAGDADGQWTAFVQQQPGARRVDTGSGWTSWEIPASGARPPTPPTTPRLPIAGIETTHNVPDINAVLDGDPVTRWHASALKGDETIRVDLGRAAHVSAVELCLGAYANQYPRALQIDVSSDGTVWTTVYAGSTALEAYDAALRSPREIPVSLPVGRDGIRYLRLRQTGVDPRATWTIVELRVVG